MDGMTLQVVLPSAGEDQVVVFRLEGTVVTKFPRNPDSGLRIVSRLVFAEAIQP
jgi:hypothetical protein